MIEQSLQTHATRAKGPLQGLRQLQGRLASRQAFGVRGLPALYASPLFACRRRGPFKCLLTRALAALALLSLLLGSSGCGTSRPPAKRAPDNASSRPRVDELNLVTMPVAVNLESKLGINGINVRVYAGDYQRPKTQPIKDGTLEILMFEGLVGDSFDQTNRCRHLWSFPAWELATYAVTTTVGTGYLFPLAWGKDQPRTDKITVVARYQPPQGPMIYSAPSYISIAPPSAPPPSAPLPTSPPPSSPTPKQ